MGEISYYLRWHSRETVWLHEGVRYMRAEPGFNSTIVANFMNLRKRQQRLVAENMGIFLRRTSDPRAEFLAHVILSSGTDKAKDAAKSSILTAMATYDLPVSQSLFDRVSETPSFFTKLPDPIEPTLEELPAEAHRLVTSPLALPAHLGLAANAYVVEPPAN